VDGNDSTAGAPPGPLLARGSSFRVWKANAAYALRGDLGYDRPVTAISAYAGAKAGKR
jgi:hypothetical protein